MAQDNFQVSAVFHVVPDGFDEDGKLRLCVSVTPAKDPKGAIDIREWPLAVAGMATRIRVLGGAIAGASIETRSVPAVFEIDVCEPVPAGLPTAGASRLWKRIFAPFGRDEGFTSLLSVLQRGETTAPRSPKPANDDAYGTYHSADLGRVVESLYSSATARSLLQRATASNGVDGADVSNFADATPSAEWWRRFAEEWFGYRSQSADVSARDQVREEMRLAGSALRAGRDAAGMVARGVVGANDACGDGGFSAAAVVANLIDIAEIHHQSAVRVPAQLAACAHSLTSSLSRPEYWTGATGAMWPTDAGRVLRKEIARFEECWGFDQASSAGTLVPDPDEDAGRKLAGILSYPTLAKYLGLVIDIRIDPAKLRARAQQDGQDPGHHYGAVAVEVPPRASVQGAAAYDWTSFVIADAAQYFGPCQRNQTVTRTIAPNDELKDGLLNLQMSYGTGKRFHLQSLDVTSAIISLRQQAMVHDTILRQPGVTTTDAPRLPELRSRGISLIDRSRGLVGDSKRVADEVDSAARAQAGAIRILDADDLLIGYRIDVAVSPGALAGPSSSQAQFWRSAGRWRSLVCRDVRFGESDVEPRFATAAADVKHRDDGFVMPMTAIDKRGGKTQEVPHQDLFAWTGESLAVTASGRLNDTPCLDDEEERKTYLDREKDLAINVDVDLPADGNRRPMPLRLGRDYIFGARAVFSHGCGLTLDHAIRQYTTNAPLLGDEAGGAFLYRRVEEVQAPEVLLPWDDRIITSESRSRGDASVLVDAPGETIDDLVVRTGRASTTTRARRFLVPPRSTFDLCEQSASFDKLTSNPQSAFSGAVRARLEANGHFPVARRGDSLSRGAFLELNDGAKAPDTAFFADPLGRTMRARLTREGKPAPDMKATSELLAFWAEGAHLHEARPLVLDLVPRPKDDNRRFVVDEVKVRQKTGRRSLTLSRLTVQLEPSETVDLEIWASPENTGLPRAYTSVAAAIASLRQERDVRASRENQASMTEGETKQADAIISRLQSEDQQVSSAALDALIAEAPLPLLSTRRVLRLVHAVDQPCRAPSFATGADGKPDMHLVELTVNADVANKVSPELESWRGYLAKHKDEPTRLWPSQAGGSATFLVGAVKVHRASTERIRCITEWNDHGPDSLKWNDSKKCWAVETPLQRAEWPVVDRINPDFGADERPVSLMWTDESRPPRTEVTSDDIRAVFHSFADGRARHLRLQLRATSRFTGYYLEPSVPQSAASVFETASPDFRAPDVLTIWKRATERPAPPIVDRVLPVFHLNSKVDRDGREVEFIREATMRVFLRAPWYSSGEGEQVGVVFWKHSVGSDTLDDCALDDQIRVYRDLISRWGADPVHVSAGPSRLLQPDQFSTTDDGGRRQAVKRVEKLQLSLAATTSAPGEKPTNAVAPLDVDIVPYSLGWDYSDDIAPLHCDIRIDPGPIYTPFIQLGLVRYQPNAVPGLELSTSTPTVMQVPPKRTGTITYGNDRSIVLQMHGVGFSNPSQTNPHPVLYVRLMTASRQDHLPRDADGGRAWRRALERGTTREWEVRPIVQDGECWWHFTCTMPPCRPGIRYGLLLEEVERMPEDRMRHSGKGGDDPAKRFFEVEVDRAPHFSHIIDLGE